MPLFDFAHYDIIQNSVGALPQNGYTHFFTRARWSTHELLLYLLSLTGPAKVSVSSFSLSEEPIRTYANAQEAGYITDFEMLLHTTVKRNKADLLFFAGNVIKRIGLMPVHAKLTLIENERYRVVVNQSANATRNTAYESGIICTLSDVFLIYRNEFNEMFENAISFHGYYA